MSKRWFPIACCLCLALSACEFAALPGTSPEARTQTTNDSEGGAIVDEAAVEMPDRPAPAQQDADWSPMELTDGRAFVSCESDYDEHGDGEPLVSLGFSALWRALSECREQDLVRLRYEGTIDSEFPALVDRFAEIADTRGIGNRILDIDSTGGRVEPAMRAGDLIGEADWTIWVREDSLCHSSCVLVLAAGDMRLIAGDIGIHRMIRVGSAATSRAELNEELRGVHELMSDYLERHGAAFAVADLMMTVPNRMLRSLTEVELDEFGLAGRNAAEDDLDRIRLARKCGDGFVRRKDDFFRAFDEQCADTEDEVDDMSACGRELRQRFGFPDRTCPSDGPLAQGERIAGWPAAWRG